MAICYGNGIGQPGWKLKTAGELGGIIEDLCKVATSETESIIDRLERYIMPEYKLSPGSAALLLTCRRIIQDLEE